MAIRSFSVKLIGNIITNNSVGVWVTRSDNFLIQNNTITANDEGIQISTNDGTSTGTILGNQINENALGIILYSSNITVKGNNICQKSNWFRS